MDRRRAQAFVLGCVLLGVSACSSAGSAATSTSPAPIPTTTSATPPPVLHLPAVSRPAPSSSHAAPTTSHPPASSSTSPRPTTQAAAPPPAHGAPVIVIDPGHSVTAHGTDAATGLDTSDYENEPEMRDVFDVALRVKAALEHAGYRVYLTRSSLYAPSNLGVRAYLANRVHADLALSIHDQAGSNGGLAFSSANNNVYYQRVGDYRVNPAGHKVTFEDSSVASLSQRYGAVFQQERQAVEHHPVRLLGDTGYDLGSRGLQAGNIWIVQLLAHVPWIYNEAGGNSAGMSGLNSTDRQTYANGLVAGVEHCIPPPR